MTGNSYCVIGAGASGLTVLKNLRERGISAECIEAEDDVGGNWYYGRPCSSVYRSTHLISSKVLTQYSDFPMPEEWPEYISHEQAREYLSSYARHFGLYQAIQFNTTVAHAEPSGPPGSGGWTVTLGSGERRQYAGLVIANGHHRTPLMPTYAGHFDGTILHSGQYRTPDILAGKRVLVVGAGNSGCDIAVEGAQNAACTFLSMRRGYHFFPKFIRGKPGDQSAEFMLRLRLPRWLRRAIISYAVYTVLGSPEELGLPAPAHKLYETHPIVNSQMLYYVGHGRIKPKPDIAELCGDKVRFVDGTTEAIDLIVYATGYQISIPFVAREHLEWVGGKPDLFLGAFPKRFDNLFVAGLIQPDSGLWGIVDYQAQLMARFIEAQRVNTRKADRFRHLKARHWPDLANGMHYVRTQRHLLEVEHYSYRRRLKRLIAQFD